jgi:hypothetical protein
VNDVSSSGEDDEDSAAAALLLDMMTGLRCCVKRSCVSHLSENVIVVKMMTTQDNLMAFLLDRQD